MELICPTCKAPVPEALLSTAGGTGQPATFQPFKQHAECACGERLVRSPDSDVDSLRAWRLNPH